MNPVVVPEEGPFRKYSVIKSYNDAGYDFSLSQKVSVVIRAITRSIEKLEIWPNTQCHI